MRRNVVASALALAASVCLAGRVGAYEAVAVSDGGTLSGRVKYDGTMPQPQKIEVTKDPEVCGKDKVNPALVIGQGNGLANVVSVV